MLWAGWAAGRLIRCSESVDCTTVIGDSQERFARAVTIRSLVPNCYGMQRKAGPLRTSEEKKNNVEREAFVIGLTSSQHDEFTGIPVRTLRDEEGVLGTPGRKNNQVSAMIIVYSRTGSGSE